MWCPGGSCLLDSDDEVRDRVTFAIALLEKGSAGILNRRFLVGQARWRLFLTALLGRWPEMPLSVVSLERALKEYVEAGNTVAPFDLRSVPVETAPATATSVLDEMFEPVEGAEESGPGSKIFFPCRRRVPDVAALWVDGWQLPRWAVPSALPTHRRRVPRPRRASWRFQLWQRSTWGHCSSLPLQVRARAVLELRRTCGDADLPPSFWSGCAVPLTESETEYVVKAVKHIFAQRVVFEYILTNTLNDQILENASVVMEGGEQDIDEGEVVVVPTPSVKYGQPVSAFVSFPLDTSIGTDLSPPPLFFLLHPASCRANR